MIEDSHDSGREAILGLSAQFGEQGRRTPPTRNGSRSSARLRPVRFALAELDLWRVQGIDLAAALAPVPARAPGQDQQPYECFPQIFIPDDSPLDVAETRLCKETALQRPKTANSIT